MTMKRFDNIGYGGRAITYEFGEGDQRRCVAISVEVLQHMGLRMALAERGIEHLLPTERLPVRQHGKIIGTVPSDFEPLAIKSKSFFYDARPGDFRFEGGGWTAHQTLGPGDLQAVPGFEWSDGREAGSSLDELAALGTVFQAMANKS